MTDAIDPNKECLEAGREAMDPAPPFRSHPSRLFVELTTRCNLSCAMCMKQSWDSTVPQGDMTKETFLSLAPAFPRLDALILNGIGESLLHPGLEEFIGIARRSMPSHGWIGFQTNGLLLDERRALLLVEAGLDRICISIDAVCPDMFSKLREGGRVEDLERAFDALRAAQERRPGSGLKVGVEFVVMRDNLSQLPDAIRWSASHGAEFAIVTHLLPYDFGQVTQPVFDSNTDRAVELYHAWKLRAEAEGIDLNSYFFINFYKFYRTDEEQRIVDFVKEMVADARSKGIFFHVRNLIARDEALADQVEEVFAGAREAADEVGIELLLPGTTPREERRCDFVADGSALVSWDGEVHPCYFLWHRFQCHFSYWRKYVPGLSLEFGSDVAIHYTYWKKSVNSRTFGNLAARGILDIWNDPTFLSFRREVMDNEFPYCSNCNLVPCDHLTADQFERDCYLTTVPCGDCFWGLGIFNCLR